MKARLLIAACAALLSAGAVQAAGIQQAFLVQNSGWMEPFYTDEHSQLKALVGAVAQAATNPSDKVYTLAFSQSSGAHVSPSLLGQGQGGAGVAGQLASLGLAHGDAQWFITRERQDATASVYFTSQGFAQLTICFVDQASEAGWARPHRYKGCLSHGGA